MNNHKRIILVLIILIVAVVLTKFIFSKLVDKKLEENINEQVGKVTGRPIIEISDPNEFLIHVPHDTVVKKIKWLDIQRADLSNNDSLLSLSKTDGSCLNFKEGDYDFWIDLIKAIPNDIQTNEKLNSFRKDFFQNLSCCKICGKIAVKDSSCLSCSLDTYEKYYRNFSEVYKKGDTKIESETEYIKNNQLFWFTTFEKDGRIDFHYHDVLYNDCNDWTPLVTNAEVINEKTKFN